MLALNLDKPMSILYPIFDYDIANKTYKVSLKEYCRSWIIDDYFMNKYGIVVFYHEEQKVTITIQCIANQFREEDYDCSIIIIAGFSDGTSYVYNTGYTTPRIGYQLVDLDWAIRELIAERFNRLVEEIDDTEPDFFGEDYPKTKNREFTKFYTIVKN